MDITATALRGEVSNTRVAAETGCDSKEWRFHFIAAGDIAVGKEII